MNLIPRPYQTNCLAAMENQIPGSYLIHVATGLGKTFIFTQYIKKFKNWKFLVLAHREELVFQLEKYIEEPIGYEKAKLFSDGERIISASIQTISKDTRLYKFPPDYFDVVIVDEAHVYASETFRKPLEYLKPKYMFGFTATPRRADGIRLDDLFEKIIFKMDIIAGIKNGFLSPLTCKRVEIDYDLRGIPKRMGDFAVKQLEEQVNISTHHQAIYEAYNRYHVRQTMIFCVTVKHAQDLCQYFKNQGVSADYIVGETKNRSEILSDFESGKIKVLTSVDVLTTGVDIPCIETLIMARPTFSQTLYIQMVGRGIRLYEGKKSCILIDCVNSEEDMGLCQASTLVGIDLSLLPKQFLDKIESADLLDIPEIVAKHLDTPYSWIRAHKDFKIMAKKIKLEFHRVNYTIHPDGSFICSLKGTSNYMEAQDALDWIQNYLVELRPNQVFIWDKNRVNNWSKNDPSTKAYNFCKALLKKSKWPEFNIRNLKSGEISGIIDRLYKRREN